MPIEILNFILMALLFALVYHVLMWITDALMDRPGNIDGLDRALGSFCEDLEEMERFGMDEDE